jgi:hypothetical protein
LWGAALFAVFSYNALQIGTYGAFGFFAAGTASRRSRPAPWPSSSAATPAPARRDTCARSPHRWPPRSSSP